MDLSTLSDADLDAAIAKTAPPPAGGTDLSHMSDEDLDAAIAKTAPTAPSTISAPSSVSDALQRLGGGGLFHTPNPNETLGVVAPPNPVTGVAAGAALMGGAMAADSAAHGDKISDIAMNGAIGAGSSLLGSGAAAAVPAVGGLAAKAITKAPIAAAAMAGSAVAGHAGAGFAAGLGESVKPMVESLVDTVAHSAVAEGAKRVLQAAAEQGPRAVAIAHYLMTQRDPEYAAAQQEKAK